jgi:GDP-L-fucose synthase
MGALVAGSSGLAGSAVMRKLLELGESPVGISSSDVDLTNREKTFEYFLDLKPNLVFCCAAMVGGIEANIKYPVEFLSTNLQIQTNIMDASFAAGVDRFIFLSSSCIYPRDSSQPMEEYSLLRGIPEETNRAYAFAKIAGMELVHSYRRQFKKRWISTIPANLYGPGDNFDPATSHVMGALIRKFAEASKNKTDVTIWGDGRVFREFLHSDDLAEALVMLVEKYDEDEPINIGAGFEISIKQLVAEIAEATEFKGNIYWDDSKPSGATRKKLSNKRISELGWKPKIDLSFGIKNSVAEFQSNFL